MPAQSLPGGIARHHEVSPSSSAKRQQPLDNEFNWILELIMHQVKEIPVVVAGDEVLVRRLLGREFAIARRFFSITVPSKLTVCGGWNGKGLVCIVYGYKNYLE
jgi:hypothetical protein